MTGGSAKRTPATPPAAVAPRHAEFSSTANSGLDSPCYERSRDAESGGKVKLSERMVELDSYCRVTPTEVFHHAGCSHVAWLVDGAWEFD